MKSFNEWIKENYEKEPNILSNNDPEDGYFGKTPDWLAPYIKENTPNSFKAIIPKNITREQTSDERTSKWADQFGNMDGESVFDSYVYGDLPIDIKYMILYFRHLFGTRNVSVVDLGSSFSVQFNRNPRFEGPDGSLKDERGRWRPWNKEDSTQHGDTWPRG